MAGFKNGSIKLGVRSVAPSADSSFSLIYLEGNRLKSVGNASGIIAFTTDITGGGSGFTPIGTSSINVTPVGPNYSFAVNDYIGSSSVAAISAGLNSRLTSNESLDVIQNNSINTLYSTYSNSTTVAAISAGLKNEINSINLIAGSNISITQNPSKTWTISSTAGGGSSIKSMGINLVGNGSIISAGEKDASFRATSSGNITGWYLDSKETTSMVISIWKLNGSRPTVSNIITSSNKPTLSSSKNNSSSNLTGWNTSVVSGDVFVVSVDSNTTSTNAVLTLIYT